MKKESLIAIVVIIGIVFLGIGFYSGLSWAKMKNKSQAPGGSASALQSPKVIQNWNGTAVGQVSKISGRVLTLSSGGDKLDVFIREDAKIQSINVAETDKKKAQQEAKELQFSDIKVGDAVTISIGPKGEVIEGYLVTLSSVGAGAIQK